MVRAQSCLSTCAAEGRSPLYNWFCCDCLVPPLSTAQLGSRWRIWDFFSHHPESCHMFTFLLDDVGIPLNYRHMPGFGVHTFKLLNQSGKEVYVKFHWIPKCGTSSLALKAWALPVIDPCYCLTASVLISSPISMTLRWLCATTFHLRH